MTQPNSEGAPAPDERHGIPVPPQTSAQSAATELHEWQHLHPLSPIVRGGVVGIAILGYAASQLIDDVFRGFGGGDSGGPVDPSDEGFDTAVGVVFDHSLIASGVIVGLLALIGLFAWLGWRFAKFRVADGQLEFRKGWLFREHRQVPLERVQAIEISRPLLAQLTGLSQVIVQSAGGGDSQLKLAFLSAGRAEEVRRELLVLAGRRDEAPRAAREAAGPGTGDGDEFRGGASGASGAGGEVGDTVRRDSTHDLSDTGREVLRVPNTRLFVATILHGGTIFIGALALIGGAIALAVYGSTLQALTGVAIALPAIGPLVFGIAVNRVQELLKHGNFVLHDTGTAARIQHGLTDKRTTTIPLHRIQAVGMVQPLWWRPFGWWRCSVNVAGVGHDPTNDQGGETTVLPVGTLDQALEILTLLDPALSEDALRRAALGDGADGGWTLVPPRAKVFDWLSWRRNGFDVSPHFLMVRSGRWWRRVAVMPHARVQSLTLGQGPLDRRLDLTTVTLVSTPGPVSVSVPHLDTETATRLLHDEARRARAARQMARSGCTSDIIPSQLVVPDDHDER